MTIILVCLALLTHYRLSITEYKNDKIAYVFDSALEGAKSTSLMVATDLENGIDKMRTALDFRLVDGKKLSSKAKSYLRSERTIDAFYIVTFDDSSQKFVVQDSQLNFGTSDYQNENIVEFAEFGLKDSIYITRVKDAASKWVVSIPVSVNGGRNVVVVAQFNKASFLDNFYSPQINNYYLVDAQGNIVLSPIDPPHSVKQNSLVDVVNSLKGESSATSLVREIETGEGELLVASSEVSIGKFRVISLIPKDVALDALKVISIKSILLVLALIGVSIIISVLGANGLTRNIAKLYQGVNEVIKGNLETRVSIKSKDEVAVLADGFNMMTEQIQKLLAETAEKARMQNELQTAQTVQSTLFPNDRFDSKEFEVFGFYEPASECGGDWYNYDVVGNRAYFWIGDATGHGVSAALITSAAKSAASVIRTIPDLKMSQVLDLMNKAVAETSAGNVLMTFFVGCLDLKTGKLTYANASHDTPYVLNRLEKYKKKDVIPVMGNNGPRLGEDATSEYFDNEIQLEVGDRVVFYTDGVTEIENTSNEQWGEGKFIRSIVKSFNNGTSLEDVGKNVLKDAYDFKGEEILHDDVTYFMVEYKGNKQ